MKKVFKASVVAASLAMAFAANAAVITSTPANLSKEGLDVKLYSTADITFDTVVKKEHASSSTIILTLSDTVDLATNAVTGGACTNDPALGTGICGDVSFDYGTGSFTFDSVVVDDDENTITFNVNLGNPLTANSAFRTTVSGLPVMMGAATVDYASHLAGEEIETGSGVISTVINQYAMSIDKKLDGVIHRENRNEFVRGAEDVAGLTDTFVLSVTDNASKVLNPAFANGTVVTVKGDFSDAVVHAPAQWASAESAVAALVNATTMTFTYNEAAFDTAATAKEDTVTFTFVGGANKIDPSNFVASASHKYNSLTGGAGTAGTAPLALLSSADAGKWILDAAVINVPYLPVGYSHLSPVVEVANLGTLDAEMIVEAVGKTGEKYGPVTLTKQAAKGAVTSVFESDLFAAFGLADGANEKLSVTFIIDADADKVSVAPYYRDTTNNNRINVISDQYKADAIR